MPDVCAGPAAAVVDSTTLAETPAAAPPMPAPRKNDAPPSQRRPHAPRKQATCPDPGSLYDILRANCGTSLFVLPILWTDAHPRLLRAEFLAQDPILTPVPAPSDCRDRCGRSGTPSPRASQHRPSDLAESLSYELTSLLSAEDTRQFVKARAIKSVLAILFRSTFSRPKSVAELDLHFGDRVFRGAVRVPVLWKSADAADSSFDSSVTRPVSSFGHTPSGARETNDAGAAPSTPSSQGVSDGPIVAYVSRSHLAMIRQNLFRIVPGPEDGDRGNTPVSRLQWLRSKQLTPTEPDRDAYLLGVFLGMAQAHFYEGAPSRMASQMLWWNNRHRSDRAAPVCDFHDVKLRILTHDDETSDFIVYTTVVTGAFLARFAQPTKAAPDAQDGGMTIEYTRVPVWPILGLKERLGRALGRDLVGDVPDVCELFRDDAATTDAATADAGADAHAAGRPGSLKRKRTERAALTEMLAASLEAETPSSSDAASGAASAAAPAMSPRAKRRQTRSLSSSLAVF